jgi:hypothetical protein
MPEHRHVFVGGLHRSGTTLLARCLADHALVSGFEDTGVPADEGQHLQSVYPVAKTYGGPGLFAFSEEAHLTEASQLVSEASRERLVAEWSRHWDLDKPILLEKSPPNLIHMRFLQALFPEAFFVVVVRHPVPVSYATKKWRWKYSLRTLVRHWVVAHEIYREDRGRVGRLLEVRFEHLVRDPDAVLARVYEFLGLDPRPTTQAVRPDSNEPYFRRWREEERSLSGRVSHALIRRELEERVNGFGYSFRDLDRAGDADGGS